MPTYVRMRSAEEPALGIERELAFEHAVAAGRVAEKALEPRRASISPVGRCWRAAIQQRGILGVGLRLHAEAAADIVREDADLLGRHLEHGFGQDLADDRRRLACGAIRRVALGWRRRRSRAPRAAPWRTAPAAYRRAARARRARRAAKAASTAAVSPSSQSSAMLPGCFRPDLRRAGGHRARHVGGGGQLLDSRSPRPRRRRAPAPRSRRRRARPARRRSGRASRRAAGMLRRHHRLAVAPREDGHRRNRADAGVDQFLPGDDGNDARHCGRGRRIHTEDVGVPDGRAHEDDMRLTGERDVIREPPGAGDERMILEAGAGLGLSEAWAGRHRLHDLRFLGCAPAPQHFPSARMYFRNPPTARADYTASLTMVLLPHLSMYSQ